jgi:hypothetical protein
VGGMFAFVAGRPASTAAKSEIPSTIADGRR